MKIRIKQLKKKLQESLLIERIGAHWLQAEWPQAYEALVDWIIDAGWAQPEEADGYIEHNIEFDTKYEPTDDYQGPENPEHWQTPWIVAYDSASGEQL